MHNQNIETQATDRVIYSTVKQFCERHPAFPIGGIRHRIFHEETNGLKKSGAIIRNGRRIFINEEKFFIWLENQA